MAPDQYRRLRIPLLQIDGKDRVLDIAKLLP